MLKLGFLASGRGSNFSAILESCRRGALAATPTLLLSNVATAGCLEIARAADLPAKFVDPKAFPSREAYDDALAETLASHGIDLLCLAGYMRLVGAPLLRRFEGRILNIHPSLLPAFPGLHGQRQALEAGVRISGCTVHFVDAGLDTGPIVMQAAVPVLPGDTETTLSSRILTEEHRIYSASIDLIARGRIRLEGRRIHFLDGDHAR